MGGTGSQGSRSLRDIAGERARDIASDAARRLDRHLPGIINDRLTLAANPKALLVSDYAACHPFTEKEIAQMQGAEGFFDHRTGQSIVFTDQVHVRESEGEAPPAAIARVILHERVGHDGLTALLKDSAFKERWNTLSDRLSADDLAPILCDYPHLAELPDQLAFEWFARQVEQVRGKRAGASLEGSLTGTAKAMWLALKDLFVRVFGSFSPNAGHRAEAEVRTLIDQATKAARNSGGERAAHGRSTEAKNSVDADLSLSQPLTRRTDKPGSWEEVRPGHTWVSSKWFLPKLQDKRPAFGIKRGKWENIVGGIARWLSFVRTAKDPWGGTVKFDNPQKRGAFADPLENRAAHLVGREQTRGAEDRVHDDEKLAWIGAVKKTIEDAQVRVRAGTETLYFRSYAEGIHMVVVEDGAVKDQYALVTQYPLELAEKRFGDGLVEKVRTSSSSSGTPNSAPNSTPSPPPAGTSNANST